MQNPAQSTNSVHYLTVESDNQGQRLDNFLISRYPGVPKSHLYRIIRSGEVRANSGRVKPTYRIKAGDRIRLPPMRFQDKEQVIVPDKLVNLLENAVLFEDDDLIVLNKPPGIAVHAGSGLAFGAIEAMRQSRRSLATRLELIHRLDRGTSGCLLVGKHRQAVLAYQDLFRQRSIGKHYQALVAGNWPAAVCRIDLALRKNVERGGERSVVVDPEGKDAVSHFSVRQRFTLASEVSVTIETGRTHQIRVHAAAQGHAVIGDDRYADNKETASFRKMGLKRLFLHCESLELPAPAKQIFIAKTDPQWQMACDKLRRNQ